MLRLKYIYRRVNTVLYTIIKKSSNCLVFSMQNKNYDKNMLSISYYLSCIIIDTIKHRIKQYSRMCTIAIDFGQINPLY